MIGILIPLLILIPTALRAEDQIINPIYGPEIEMKNPILDWSATDMHELLYALKDYEAAKNRTPIDDMLNKALLEYNNGSDDTAEQEELL